MMMSSAKASPLRRNLHHHDHHLPMWVTQSGNRVNAILHLIALNDDTAGLW
jgi:hypothetical protein